MIASRSPDKLREIRQILEPDSEISVHDLLELGIEERSEEEGIEVYDTFADNALAKARYYSGRAGMLALADDSGLCVDALDGAPGVYSKRFSGRTELRGRELDRANNERLLHLLAGVSGTERGAHYRCAVALFDPTSSAATVVEGRCGGRILEVPRGGGGFGYDPLFQPDDFPTSFGEIDPVDKNRISHRAAAVRLAAEVLRRGFPVGFEPA